MTSLGVPEAHSLNMSKLVAIMTVTASKLFDYFTTTLLLLVTTPLLLLPVRLVVLQAQVKHATVVYRLN